MLVRLKKTEQGVRLRNVYTASLLTLALLFGGSSALNAEVLLGADPGIPDTVYVESADVDAGDEFLIRILLTNDQELAGGTIGIGWGSPDLTLDSITYTGTVVSHLPASQTPSLIDNDTQRSGLCGFFIIFPPGVVPGSGVFANYWFSVDPGAADQFIELDSVFVPPAGSFVLVALDGNVNFTPQFVGGLIKVGNPSEPPTIDVQPDTFYFEAVEGGINPAAQALDVVNIGLGTLNWSATTGSGWLDVSPENGTAPSIVQVTANSIGLAAGLYQDTILISDPGATNNPFPVPVTLRVTIPPPTIGVSASTVYFNAIADSTNPPAQVITVTNIGQGTLDWSATNSELWLDVTPLFGDDSTDVNLSVDITGLPFGDYQDTVVITDTSATNNPVKIAVSLTVASDLPIMRLDPDTLIVVVDIGATTLPAPGELIIDTAYFRIENDGAGLMTYTAVDSSSRILNIIPDSGDAPNTVAVELRFGEPAPGDLYDHLWVSSPQAINSPQRLELRYHFTENPANLTIAPDTLEFDIYECEQGEFVVPQIRSATFGNGGETISFEISGESVWLNSFAQFVVAPATVNFSLKGEIFSAGWLAGEYLDSMRIDAPLSQTNPQYLFARLTVKPTDQTGQILPNFQQFTVTARENDNFIYCPLSVLTINNFRPGCFDWEISESVSWLNFTHLSGTNPDNVGMSADGTGLTFGEYFDSFEILSDDVNNSPNMINVKLRVWRLFGDADYDNRITITDAVYIINYIFNGGPNPQPETKLGGDCNCTGTVTIADVVYLLEYIFAHGNAPCGNDGM